MTRKERSEAMRQWWAGLPLSERVRRLMAIHSPESQAKSKATRRARMAGRVISRAAMYDEEFNRVWPGSRPSDALIRERDRRAAAPSHDLVGALMGDPPIGFSALDKRARTC